MRIPQELKDALKETMEKNPQVVSGMDVMSQSYIVNGLGDVKLDEDEESFNFEGVGKITFHRNRGNKDDPSWYGERKGASAGPDRQRWSSKRI